MKGKSNTDYTCESEITSVNFTSAAVKCYKALVCLLYLN